MLENYNLFLLKKKKEYEGGEITFESVDQIVIQQLETIESNTVQKRCFNRNVQQYRNPIMLKIKNVSAKKFYECWQQHTGS